MYKDEGSSNSGVGAAFGGFIGALAGDVVKNNNNDCGRNNGCNGGSDLTYAMGVNAGENGKYRDIAVSTESINNNVDSAETNILSAINFSDTNVVGTVTRGTAQILSGISTIENFVQTTDRNNVVLFKDLDTKLCNMASALTATSVAGTQKILDKICDTNEKAAALKLNEVQRERDLYATGNYPVVQVGTIVRQNPCEDRHSNEQINIINQNVNAIGSQVQQLAGVFSAFQPALAKLATI